MSFVAPIPSSARVSTPRAGGVHGTDGTEDVMGGAVGQRDSKGTPARARRWTVTLLLASVLSVPFALDVTGAAAATPTGGAGDETSTTATPCTAPAGGQTAGSAAPGSGPGAGEPGGPAAEPASDTTSPTSATSSSSATQGPAPTTTSATPTSTPTCPDGHDTGGSPTGRDNCADTGGSPTGTVPSCRGAARLGDPDARLADCAGDIDHPTCAALVDDLAASCASTAWPQPCRSTAAGMLQICTDGDVWSSTACGRARVTLVRYCIEVSGADPDRCPALRPSDASGSGQTGGPGTGTSGGAGTTDASGGAGTTGGPATTGTTGGAGGPGGVGSDLGSGNGAVSRDDNTVASPAPGNTDADAGAGASPAKPVASAGPPGEVSFGPVLATGGPANSRSDRRNTANGKPRTATNPQTASIGADGVGPDGFRGPDSAGTDNTHATGAAGKDRPGTELADAATSSARLGPSSSSGTDAWGGLADEAPPETLPGRRLSVSVAQRSNDRWSLVPLGGALLLVMVSSAFDLRGRRRW